MADNSAAKSHLNSIESKLNDMRDLNSLSTTVHQTTLDLANILGSGKNLFVDNDIRLSVNSIVDRLKAGGTGSIQDDIDAEYRSISGQYIAAPRSKSGDTIRNSMTKEWRDLQGKRIAINAGNVTGPGATTRSTALKTRSDEYTAIKQHIDGFDPNFSVADMNINVTAPAGRIDLNARRNAAAITRQPKYELCDADGKSLGSGPYKLSIGGTEYTLSGINWNDAARTYDFAGLTIYPPLNNLPQTVELSVNATCSGVTNGINVVHNKKFKLTLNDGVPRRNDLPSRDRAFEEYENSGGYHAISAQLNTKINVRDDDPEIGKNALERKAIEAALKYKGGTKYDSLTETQKRLFYERICRSFSGGAGVFSNVYTGGGEIDEGPARYDKMKAWFINGSRPWNNDSTITGSASAYKTYIHSHLDEKCDEYILNTLQNYLQRDAVNTALKAELSRFLQEIDNNKIDGNINCQLHREFNRRQYRMKRGPRSPFRPRDVNYMRFFSNSSVSLKNQQVNIYTKLNNAEPVKYDMDVNITGKNSIEVAIKIAGTNEIIKQKSSQPATLVCKIMEDQRIKDGKVRAHIGFNIYKSMIQLAKEKNISLTYRGMEGQMRGRTARNTNETRRIELDNNGNIVVRQINHLTTTNIEKDIFVFDQNSFLNVNEFDDGQTNGRLRMGLETLGFHFNKAMNHLHKQYRKGTERRVMGLIHSKNRMKLPSSFRLSPIKKILNCGTTTNFDFNTSVNSNGRSVKIDFRKNKFTLETQYKKSDGTMENITIKGRDLGKLLNHRKGRVRIFDGMERDMVEGIYSAMIDALRNNAKVARTNFGVKDDITGNMYVLDEDGQFGVIAKEDFVGCNRGNNPMRGIFRRWKKKGSLKKRKLDRAARRPLEPEEEKELLKNPFLMQRLVKAMNRRMGLGESLRSIFVK